MIVFLILISAVAGRGRAAAQQPSAPPPSKFKLSSVYYDTDWIPIQYTCGVTDASSPDSAVERRASGHDELRAHFSRHGCRPRQRHNGRHTLDSLEHSGKRAMQLPASVKPDTSPDGIQQGKNIRGVNGCSSPCPPPGAMPHHYVFELYALDTKLDLAPGSSRADLLKVMDGHVIGKASIVGIFRQNIDDKSWRWGGPKQPQSAAPMSM